MSLQFNLLDWEDRELAIPIVFQNHVIYHFFSVQDNRHTVTNHLNIEGIPFTQFIVGHFRRLALVYLIVVQATGTYLRTNIYPRSIPDLDLRSTTQINTGISLRAFRIQHPIHIHLEITILLFRT